MPSTDTLPPAPELFSRWGAFQTWWGRTNKEQAQIAEARLLSRLQFFSFKGVASTSADSSSTVARVGLVELPGKNRLINTLIIQQKPSASVSASTIDNTNKDTESDDQGRTPIAQTTLDIKTSTDEHDGSMISPPAPGETAIVICHGYGAGLGFFYRNYHSLSQIPNAKIYAIDWLGMGGSSRPDFKFKHSSKTPVNDVVKQAEDFFISALEELREVQKIDKMILIGHSLGGYLSAVYALKHPERVEKLILASPVGIPENPEAQRAPLPNPPESSGSGSGEPSPKSANTAPAPPSSLFRKLAMGAWERNITPQSIMRFTGPFGPSLVAAYTSRRFAYLEADELRDLNSYIYHISSKSGSGEYALSTILAPGAFARWPLMDRLKDLKMPTVFMYGESDWMDWKAGEQARRTMSVPTALMRIPSAGHHLYMDNPLAFDKAIFNIITRPWDKQQR
ncbi:hypothetical protein BGZ59_010206 [Podila verticillata]|nr:hypothetical protein BGZ59_010206 [Podila verticillata]KAI9234179.1 MAG: Alpha/Beta hydrolase protein [Podila humilis]KFH68098.1 hypothetical protein MVEG_06828 [Podila verticillata NRRL 6337]